MQIDKFNAWIKENSLQVIQTGQYVFQIPGVGVFLYIKGNPTGKIFDDRFYVQLSEVEESILAQILVDYYLFEFGGQYYYCPYKDKVQLIPFKYLGKALIENDIEWPYLGIHGHYELLNGSRLYEDWCSKANFLGYKAIGVCERNTLAGVLPFQIACQEAKIKSIIGESVIVRQEKDLVEYVVKLYVKDAIGWNNLLLINKKINVDNGGYIYESEFFELCEGLVCVLTVSFPFDVLLVNQYKSKFSHLYFQMDTVEYLSNETDRDYLMRVKNYIDNYAKLILPILINDTYYLDREDSHIKKILNKVASGKSMGQSNSQYFKTLDDNIVMLEKLFKDFDKLSDLLEIMIKNAQEVNSVCNFIIPLGELRLPKYELSIVESQKYQTNRDFFIGLLDVGFQKKVDKKGLDPQLYFDRLEHEIRVIEKGGFIDYFLILADIILWCKQQNILTGVGRGSSAGSLVAYLLDITKIDPLKYGLLFERFLNESRIAKGLPDVDSDFEGNRRDEVKRYMEERHGIQSVASVGTYTTMKLKAALKDLGRERGLNHSTVNIVTSILDTTGEDWKDLFQIGMHRPIVGDFIQKNPELINDARLCLNSARSASVHPSAVIIVPKTDKNGKSVTIFDQLPIKKIDEILVVEWEGEYLEKAGFLKEDILGIRQLDKFRTIINLVKKHKGTDLDLDEVPLDDSKVYDLFCKGSNGDVFHFGSPGLTQYGRQVKPIRIEDLIAMIALYRPGTMETNAHEDYVRVREGISTPKYDYMLEAVTKETCGVYIYQEQAIQAVQILGGFSLSDADEVRRALGKKLQGVLDSYKKQFIEGAIKNGCPNEEACNIWDKMETFAGYAFNKSHAAAYAITGYFCQWLKVNYPLEFWSTALQYADEEEVSRYVGEIKKIGQGIDVVGVDINKSSNEFTIDPKLNKIYCSISKVKWVGDVAVDVIIEERKESGMFFSLEEFCSRIEKRKVNKRCIENLILSGAFDEIEKVKRVEDRLFILRKYWEIIALKQKDKDPDFEDVNNITQEHWWMMRQKSLTGLGYINFQNLAKTIKKNNYSYVEPVEFQSKTVHGDSALAIGIVKKALIRVNKHGAEFLRAYLEVNGEEIMVMIWNETFVTYKEYLTKCEGKIIAVQGKIMFDKYTKMTNLLSTDDSSKIFFF